MEFIPALQGALDEQKPSLFEILSEHELAALIPPSLRYLLAVATHRNPRYLLRILNNFDEIYALLSLAVERYYLRTFGGSFTENFYGLKRERVLRIKGGETPRARIGAPGAVREVLALRDGDVWRNLMMMVGLPYVKRKLDESYDIHAAGLNVLGPAYRDRERYPQEGSVKEKFLWAYKWFLRHVYPSVNAAYYFSLLAFNLAYLFDGTKFHSPFLWIIGTRLRRLNEADQRAIAQATTSPTSGSAEGARPGERFFSPRVLARTIYPKLLASLRLLLPGSIFALKFLEWWHNSDFARQLTRKANEGLELPPPVVAGLPKTAAVKSEKQDDKRDTSFTSPPISTKTFLPILTVPAPAHSTSDTENTTALCPICVGPIQTPTAAQSGYVYCYACIFKWVEGTHARQEKFMDGSGEEEECTRGWAEEDEGNRTGKWESGAGRDAVTGRRLLGGTGGLRRVMV